MGWASWSWCAIGSRRVWLAGWNRREHSSLKPLQRFAESLREDEQAVRLGLGMSVSNGPVEGHVNRLKMLKRQMYGRAGLELLARRMLLAG